MNILWKLLIVLLTLFIWNSSLYAQKDIEDKWKESLDYQKFLKLKALWKDNEAEKVQILTITKIANEVLILYVKDFKDKFEDKMTVKIEALPFWLKTVLADAYIKWKVLLSPEHMNQKDLNKFVWGLFWYIDSIHDSKWITEKKAYSLEKKFPELKGTKYMELLINLWKSFDRINTIDRNINESNRNSEQYKKESEQWDKMIKQLQALPI